MIIDRFEGDRAILELEDGTFELIAKRMLPPQAKEGDVLSFIIENEHTKNRRAQIEEKMNRLFREHN